MHVSLLLIGCVLGCVYKCIYYMFTFVTAKSRQHERHGAQVIPVAILRHLIEKKTIEIIN